MSGVHFQICMYVGELLLHPPDLPIRTQRPTAANTLNLPQAAGLDVRIKHLAIKSLQGHKTLEKFTIKRQRDNKDRRRGIISVTRFAEVEYLPRQIYIHSPQKLN